MIIEKNKYYRLKKDQPLAKPGGGFFDNQFCGFKGQKVIITRYDPCHDELVVVCNEWNDMHYWVESKNLEEI